MLQYPIPQGDGVPGEKFVVEKKRNRHSKPRRLQRKHHMDGTDFKEVIRGPASWSECAGFACCTAAAAPPLVHVVRLQVSPHLQI